MKKMDIIRKGELVGVLLSFLLISCESSVTSPEDNSEQLFLSFDMRLPVDGNGYYHLDMNENTWQTLHKVSARIETGEGEPVEFFWVEWESDLYWYLGDTLGYIINQHLNDSGVYVSVDTSYMVGFSGMEVPTSNMISYSNGYGEINNMIAPVRSMIGDTLILTAIWSGSEKRFGIVLD
tara:strand:- start:12 stop:548 length:537 start_codon:yes stop_codon:yes gene_type:complete